DDRTVYRPGEIMTGSVGWDLDKPPTAVELRLFWHTRGKGDRDVGIADRIAFDQPQQRDQRDFSLTLPDRPFSFSGKLISLMWALELVAQPGNAHQRLEITLSPTGAEVDLLAQPGGET